MESGMKWKCVAAGILLASIAQAEELRIQSLDRSGQLVFDESSGATTYRVEWAGSLEGPWTNSWEGLTHIIATGSGSVTCSVPMFYRVVATVVTDKMVFIPAGSFSMGNVNGDSDAGSSELPVHTVSISAFYMDETEVTKATWDTVYTWATENGYSFANTGAGKATNHPVRSVSWDDCVKWANARSEIAGLSPCYTNSDGTVYRTGTFSGDCNWDANGYRLPSEAEWEYAARGGLSDMRFPWGETITHSNANYYSSATYDYDISLTRGFHPDYYTGGDPYSSPVATFAPNGYGLYNMMGNTREWVWDWFGNYSSSSQTDPHGPASGTYRVARGGHSNTYSRDGRNSVRAFFSADTVNKYQGFRLARNAE